VAKVPSTIEYAFLEHCLREDLNEHARRAMAVLQPIRLTITNYPEGAKRAARGGEQPQLPRGRTRRSAFPPPLDRGDDFLETPVPK
jgi:glutaminyl-tRNA synthetase